MACSLPSRRGGRGLVQGTHVPLRTDEASSAVQDRCIEPNFNGKRAVVKS